MRQLSIGQKLQAVSFLARVDGISHFDISDIRMWLLKVGPKYDTTVLSDNAVERINTIYHANFE